MKSSCAPKRQPNTECTLQCLKTEILQERKRRIGEKKAIDFIANNACHNLPLTLLVSQHRNWKRDEFLWHCRSPPSLPAWLERLRSPSCHQRDAPESFFWARIQGQMSSCDFSCSRRNAVGSAWCADMDR